MKASLSHSILATKHLETVVNNDFLMVALRFGKQKDVQALLDTMRSVTEDVMASFRANLLKLEHEINTKIENEGNSK